MDYIELADEEIAQIRERARLDVQRRIFKQWNDNKRPDSATNTQWAPIACSECAERAVVIRFCDGGTGCWRGRPVNSVTHVEFYCHGCGYMPFPCENKQS